MISTQDFIKYSLYCVNVAKEASVSKTKFGESYRARARSIYEMIVYGNIPLTLAYLSSKASESLLLECFRILKENYDKVSDASKNLAPLVRKISHEQMSYAAYGASILLIISKVLGLDFKSIDPVVSEIAFDKLAQKYIIEAAKWLKLFSEAKLPRG